MQEIICKFSKTLTFFSLSRVKTVIIFANLIFSDFKLFLALSFRVFPEHNVEIVPAPLNNSRQMKNAWNHLLKAMTRTIPVTLC